MIGSKYSQRLDHYQSQVVVLVRAGGEFFDAVEEGLDDRRRAQVAMLKQEIEYSLFAEFDAIGLWRVRLGQSVGVEEERVALIQAQCLALVLLLVEDSEQHPARFQRFPFARSLDQQRRVMARVAVIEGLSFGVDDGVNESQKQLPAQVAVQSQIGVAQDARRSSPAPGHAAQDAARGRHAHRSAHAFARDVADQNPHAVGRERDVVVKIAAQVQRRLQPRGYVEALNLRRRVWDHRALDVAGHQDFALQLTLAFDVLGVEPGVDDGDAQVVGDVLYQPPVIFVEGVHAAAFERERADHLVLVYERDGDLGALPLVFPPA